MGAFSAGRRLAGQRTANITRRANRGAASASVSPKFQGASKGAEPGAALMDNLAETTPIDGPLPAASQRSLVGLPEGLAMSRERQG